MFPVGWLMTFVLWGFFMIVCKPEKKMIPGLKGKGQETVSRAGPITRKDEILPSIVGGCIISWLHCGVKSFVPAFSRPDKTAIILLSTFSFFVTGILDIDDLEEIPWNIILLFAGAMSIGFCLWETGAAEWLAINWLVMFQESHWFIFVMGIAFFVMIMTNFIMNVAAIAISLPVALVIAPYLGVAGRGDPVRIPGGGRYAVSACWWARHQMPLPTTPSSLPPGSSSCTVYRQASFS